MGEDLKINVWTKQDMFRKIFRKIGGSSKDCQMAKELKKTLAIRMTVAIISMSLLDLQSWICVKTMHLLSCLHSHFWVNTTNFQLFQKQYSNQSPRFLECYLSFQKSWFIYYCTTYQYKYTYYIYICKNTCKYLWRYMECNQKSCHQTTKKNNPGRIFFPWNHQPWRGYIYIYMLYYGLIRALFLGGGGFGGVP